MKFPDIPNFSGFFTPSGVEAELSHLQVIGGSMPLDLDGSSYRVAPDPQFQPIAGHDIWFNGDGMITRFRFQNGEVSLRQRWARIDKFRMEREAAARMTRWTVGMTSNSDPIRMTPLADMFGEFPRIDDRFAGRKNRYGWQLAQDLTNPIDLPDGTSATGTMMNILGRINLETGDCDQWWIGPVSSLQGPAFIPRPGSTQEGDGYLVMIENRLTEMGSRLLLFDAMRMADGPVATTALPIRLPMGLHGNWAPAARAHQN